MASVTLARRGDDRSVEVVSRSVGVVDLVEGSGAVVARLAVVLALGVVYGLVLRWHDPGSLQGLGWWLASLGGLFAVGYVAWKALEELFLG